MKNKGTDDLDKEFESDDELGASYDAYKTLLEAGVSKNDALKRTGLTAQIVKDMEEEEEEDDDREEGDDNWYAEEDEDSWDENDDDFDGPKGGKGGDVDDWDDGGGDFEDDAGGSDWDDSY